MQALSTIATQPYVLMPSLARTDAPSPTTDKAVTAENCQRHSSTYNTTSCGYKNLEVQKSIWVDIANTHSWCDYSNTIAFQYSDKDDINLHNSQHCCH